MSSQEEASPQEVTTEREDLPELPVSLSPVGTAALLGTSGLTNTAGSSAGMFGQSKKQREKRQPSWAGPRWGPLEEALRVEGLALLFGLVDGVTLQSLCSVSGAGELGGGSSMGCSQ